MFRFQNNSLCAMVTVGMLALSFFSGYSVSHAQLTSDTVIKSNADKAGVVKELKDNSPRSLLFTIINIILSIVAGLAIIILIIAGILYMTSGGDETRIETAKKWLIYAIVGLIIAVLSFAIVLIVERALGTGSGGAIVI